MARTDGAGRGQVAAGEMPSEQLEERVSAVVDVEPGGTFDLRVAPVTKRIEGRLYEMLAYNGSIPGPILRVRQGSEIAVAVSNETEIDTTVHWHGLRLENRSAGINRHGGGDARALRRRGSDPRRPRAVRWRP